MEKLSKAQKSVMDYASHGWHLYQSGGLAIHVNGKRICDRITVDVLVRKGLLKQVSRWEWEANLPLDNGEQVDV